MSFLEILQYMIPESAKLLTGFSTADVVARILFSLIATTKKYSSFAIYTYLAAEYASSVVLFSYVIIPIVPASTSFSGQMTVR